MIKISYCTYSDINLLTNITSSDVADADVTSIIVHATPQLNADITCEVTREPIGYIDVTRTNKVDGSNTTFYVQNWKGKYLADFDDDGDVDISDIIVYQVASDGTETTLTVTTITHNQGKFVLSTAPNSGVRLYVTYRWCFEDCSTPSALVKKACIYLTAALCYEKINSGKSPSIVFGNARFTRHMKAYNEWYQKYEQIVNKINRKMADYGESENIV